jgi:hypothetical protein
MLKLLACLFMLLDHIGFYFSSSLPMPLVLVLRSVGRLAFPIFAWSVARGFTRTRNLLRYFLRLCLFAILTEILFRIIHPMAGINMDWSNVLVTFSLSLVLLAGYQMATRSTLDMIASLRPISPTPDTIPTAPLFDVRINIGGIELDRRIGLPLGILMMLLAMGATLWLKPDYGIYGLCTVWLFYAAHDRIPEKDQFRWAMQGFILLNLIFMIFRIATKDTTADWAILQCLSIAAVPLCYLRIRERKPAPVVKYAFYLFYPLHVLILLLLRIFIWPA